MSERIGSSATEDVDAAVIEVVTLDSSPGFNAKTPNGREVAIGKKSSDGDLSPGLGVLALTPGHTSGFGTDARRTGLVLACDGGC